MRMSRSLLALLLVIATVLPLNALAVGISRQPKM